MRELIDQLACSLETGLYYLSLFGALAIPDIAGALDSDDGRASGERYEAWYEEWVRPRFREKILEGIPLEARQYVSELENPLTGETCYRFRCSLLHQGSSQHPRSPFSRIIFIEPRATSSVVHYVIMDDALCIDLTSFCREVISGARMWLETVENTERYRANYNNFARRHPEGLKPYIGGVPVIG
jgi:hypothetical protein